MKKLISILLAAVMFLLPAVTLAEGQESVAESVMSGLNMQALQELINSDFTARYMVQGQELTTDLSVKAGPELLQLLPEQLQTAVKDLLDVTTFRSTVQAADGMFQSGTALLLNGESALETRTAFDRNALYFNSSITGDMTIKVTAEQVKQLLMQLLQQAVDQGKLPGELVDSLINAAAMLKDDPIGFLKKAVGQPDLNGLLMQVTKMLSTITATEVTEAPAAMPDAKVLITVPVVKEDLNALGGEIGTVLWSMPAVQKLASLVQVNGEPVTEEQVMQKLTTIGNHLAEDTCILIYMNENGQKIYVESAAKVIDEGQTVDITMNVLAEVDPESGKVTEKVEFTADDGNIQVAAHVQMGISMQDGAQTIDYSMSADVTEGGTTFTAVTEQFTIATASADTSRSSVINGIYRLQMNAESAPIGILFSMEDNSIDAGDHAEENFSAKLSLEGGDELLTMNGTAVTGLAEAYIITPDAVEVLSLSESERSQLLSDVQSSLPLTLMGLIGKLPASVQQLVMGQMMGGN